MENFHADSVKRVAIVGSGLAANDSAAKELKAHNITLQSLGQLYEEIGKKIKEDWWPETEKAIPETLPILKGIQYALRYRVGPNQSRPFSHAPQTVPTREKPHDKPLYRVFPKGS